MVSRPLMPDDGFEIDPTKLPGVAGQIGVAYDDLFTATMQFSGDYPDPDEFGTPVSYAWSFFSSEWAGELQTFSLAVTEMITKVQAVGVGYLKADAKAASAARGVGG